MRIFESRVTADTHEECAVPYTYPNLSNKSTTTSPFTIVFKQIGSTAAASYMNAVILTSADVSSPDSITCADRCLHDDTFTAARTNRRLHDEGVVDGDGHGDVGAALVDLVTPARHRWPDWRRLPSLLHNLSPSAATPLSPSAATSSYATLICNSDKILEVT